MWRGHHKDRRGLGLLFLAAGVIKSYLAFRFTSEDTNVLIGLFGLVEGALGLILLFSREHPKGTR